MLTFFSDEQIAPDGESSYDRNHLVELLLRIGGTRVSDSAPELESEIAHLIERGTTRQSLVRLRYMVPSQCHTNAARLFEDEAGLAIATGYGLSEDGIWRQHSWLVAETETTLSAYIDHNGEEHAPVTVQEGEIIETTEIRSMYYGVVLTQSECRDFCALNR